MTVGVTQFKGSSDGKPLLCVELISLESILVASRAFPCSGFVSF